MSALAYPDPPLTDGAVSLRAWEEGDLPLLERGSRDAYVARIERLPSPFDQASARAWIARQQAYATEGCGWTFAIVELETREPVGGAGITFRHPPGAAEPGVWIVERRRNQGLAGRATGLLCRWALTADTGIARVQAVVEPWNAAAQRVLEKVGFQHEGLLRAYTSYDDGRGDVYLYSLLRSDLA
jgi:ribosomal-protein-alanine N-acetyltransferase